VSGSVLVPQHVTAFLDAELSVHADQDAEFAQAVIIIGYHPEGERVGRAAANQ